MLVTLARSMDAVAICTCSLPTAGLPRHLPLTLSLLPRTTSPTTGGGGGGGGPAPASLAPGRRPRALPRRCSRFSRSAAEVGGGGPPQRPAGTSEGGGQSLNPAAGEPVEGDVPPPESGALPVRVGVRSGAWREQPAPKAPGKPGVFALGWAHGAATLLGWGARGPGASCLLL